MQAHHGSRDLALTLCESLQLLVETPFPLAGEAIGKQQSATQCHLEIDACCLVLGSKRNCLPKPIRPAVQTVKSLPGRLGLQAPCTLHRCKAQVVTGAKAQLDIVAAG